MASVLFYLGAIAIFLGATLDLLNVVWGYTSARGGDYKSGVLAVPAILYCVGAAMCIRPLGSPSHLIVSLVLVVLHVACFGLIPAAFDYVFDRNG